MRQRDIVVWIGCGLLFLAGAVWGGAWPKADFFKVKDIHDFAETIAAFATVVAVAFGVTAWKKQLRAQSDHDLARRMLLDVEKLKAQTGWMIIAFRKCIAEKNFYEANHPKLQPTIKYLREELSKIDERYASVDAVLLEAEVIWKSDFPSILPLFEIIDLCKIGVRSYLAFLDDPNNPSGTVNDDLGWIGAKLNGEGWFVNEIETRLKLNSLVSNLTTYLQAKLIS